MWRSPLLKGYGHAPLWQLQADTTEANERENPVPLCSRE